MRHCRPSYAALLPDNAEQGDKWSLPYYSYLVSICGKTPVLIRRCVFFPIGHFQPAWKGLINEIPNWGPLWLR